MDVDEIVAGNECGIGRFVGSLNPQFILLVGMNSGPICEEFVAGIPRQGEENVEKNVVGAITVVREESIELSKIQIDGSSTVKWSREINQRRMSENGLNGGTFRWLNYFWARITRGI